MHAPPTTSRKLTCEIEKIKFLSHEIFFVYLTRHISVFCKAGEGGVCIIIIKAKHIPSSHHEAAPVFE